MAEENQNEKSLEEKLAECESRRDEYLAGWQRAKADFINYKKDELKRLEEISRYGTEDLIIDLIGVLDNFDLGISIMEKVGPLEKGIYMIRAQFEDVLKRKGLERVNAKIGKPLDPSIAEAISDIESEEPPGTVVEEIEPGYRLYDKIVRPVRVRVARGSDK
ncbi:MAG: nucleotide exchange factor GrpE [Patescibacteria group bacterium]